MMILSVCHIMRHTFFKQLLSLHYRLSTEDVPYAFFKKKRSLKISTLDHCCSFLTIYEIQSTHNSMLEMCLLVKCEKNHMAHIIR